MIAGRAVVIRSKRYQTFFCIYTTLLVRRIIPYNRNEFTTINRSIHLRWLLLLFLENKFQIYYYVLMKVLSRYTFKDKIRKTALVRRNATCLDAATEHPWCPLCCPS